MSATNPSPETWYRFRPGWGWIEHLWKSLILQSHAEWRAPLSRVLPKGGVAIDVGAHGGQFTRLLSSMVGPTGTVVAVEPSGYARSILAPALFLRGVRNAIVVACALGDRCGVQVLRTPLKRLGAMGWGLANLSAADQQQRATISEPVPVLTLDDLVGAMALARIDFIKVDIEGHEAAFVAGSRATLARHRPALLLEMVAHHLRAAGSSIETLWSELEHDFSYTPYQLRDGRLHRLTAPPERDPNILWLPAPLE
jgi:FkbM family methyltransferase